MKFVTDKKDCAYSPARDAIYDCLISSCVNQQLKPEFVMGGSFDSFRIIPRSEMDIWRWHTHKPLWEYRFDEASGVDEQVGRYLDKCANPGFEFECPVPQEFLK